MLRDIERGTHAILRIGAGVLFVEHGLQKLFGMLGGFGAPGGTVTLTSQFGVAGVLELVGGTLLILGLFTRPVSAILAVEMLVAFLIAHAPQGGWPIQNQGELALLYAAIFLFLAAHGGGPFSLDALMPSFKPNDRRSAVTDRRQQAAA